MADLLEEMQDIFESCTLEKDNKIRSSVVIEAITLKYCLNDEVKCALVNKLDPNSLDVSYTKEDLVTVFKEWISDNGSPNDLSPLLFPRPSRFRPISSTPIGVAMSTKSLFLPFSAQHQEEFSCEMEGVFKLAESSSSHSSTNKRLTFHKNILESRLNHSEKHANSMEKKYETLNALFGKQKLELERLKQEVKTYREMEQSMEEMNERTRKKEKEAEARYSRIESDLVSANSKIELLESMVTHLNENLQEAQLNFDKKESEYLIERHRKENLEIEVSRKDEKIQELSKQVNVLVRNNADYEFSASVMLDEKLALSNELNDLRERLLILSQPQDLGIPLCDELPSIMLQFPEESICSSSLPSDTSINSNRVVASQETQTDLAKVEDKISIIETTSSCSQTEIRIFTSQEAQTDLLNVEDKIVASQETQTGLPKVEDKIVSNIETTSSCSQTEIRIFASRETQSDALILEDKVFTSQETQTDILQIEDKSWISEEVQTEINNLDVHLPQRVKHYLMILLRFSISTMTTSLSILVALFAILLMFFYVCQNNRCVPVLRYPRGSPPV